MNTNKVTDMSWMFYNCYSLLSLLGISNWNTINVENMTEIYSNCASLSSLPDIYKWNICNKTIVKLEINCSPICENF